MADRDDQRYGDVRDEARVCVGAIAGAFGVRGEARIKAFTTDAGAIGDYGPLETEDGGRRFDVRVTRAVKGGLAARLSGVNTREEAEALRGVRLYVSRSRLPELEEDEFYHADLIGMEVVDLRDEKLGVVRSVQNYGAGDFLEVFVDGARWPALLPFTREAVPHVDLAERRVIADPPEGVFSDAADEDAEQKNESGRTRDPAPGLDAAYDLRSPADNIQLYRNWAETYDAGFAATSGYRSPKVIADAYVAAGGAWPAVDAGCGTGLIADHLPTDAVIDGLDISPEMLSQARAKGRYRELAEADLTQAIAKADESYAGLVSAGTFTHGHVGVEALTELMRILRPGAICAISGNRAFLRSGGFEDWLDAMSKKGAISTPSIAEERIYEEAGSPPAGHENDLGLVIVFKKL